jgi:hypothetical protein
VPIYSTTRQPVQPEQGILRQDLNVISPGHAVIRKIIAGSNIELTYTGIDPGTGDVTISYVPSSSSPNPNVVLFNNTGSGNPSGSSYNGSQSITISYNSIGAQGQSPSLTSLTNLVYSGTTAFVKMTGANLFTLDTNVYLTANQTITLSGDITGSGNTAISTLISNNVVTLAKLAQVSTSTILGRVTGGTGNVEALTSAQATTVLNVFTDLLKGLVPASGGVSTNFLRADGVWAAPPGGGGGSAGTTTNSLTINNSGSGNSSGITFNGSAAVTISYNTVGAQQASSVLSGLAALSWTSGTPFVKMTAAGTFSLDTATYYLASNPSGYTNNTGTVTSVAIALPGIFGLTGSPITTSGTLSVTLASQTANTVFIAPNGSAGAPTFRALLLADLPSLSTTNVSEGTNLYYTDARVRAAVSFVAGTGAYNSSTGVFTIPTNTNQLVNGAGYITGYTETDTLASVTGRGATTTIAISAPNFYDATGSYNVNLGSGGSEGRGLVVGYSGGSYGGIGYNVRHTTTGGSYIAPGTDTSSYILFSAGGINFYGAPSGAAGRTLSYTTLGTFSSSGLFNAVNINVNGNQVLHAANYNSYSPTLTGTGASGTWGISISGNAATTSQTNFSSLTVGGTQVVTNNGGTWNIAILGNSGTSTLAANSSLLNGYAASSSATANTIALRDGSGYMQAVYYYSSNSNRSTSGINSLTGKDAAGAGYMYEFTAGAVQTFLGLGSNAYTSTAYLPLTGGTLTGSLYINNGSPTIYLQDSDQRSAMIHVNSNLFYILRGSGTNSTTWSQFNGYWPLEINLENNNATFGGSIIAPVGSFGTNAYGSSSAAIVGRVFAPGGAAYSSNPISGAIKIRFPFRANDSMWSMKVRIYNYAQNQTSEYLLGNYSSSAGAYNWSATYLGGSASIAYNVRFGNDGTYDCVWIGETSTSWSYPVVSVVDFTGGYVNGSANNYLTNWDISVVTSFGTVGAVVSPNINFNEVSAYSYRGNGNVGGTGSASYHPDGIYSGSTQWLYGTTYRNNSATYGHGNLYFDGNYGYGLVGLYSAIRYQAIFAMGDSYKLPVDGTTPGSLYGMAWSHPSTGGQAANLSSHGLLVMQNGVTMAAISTNIWISGQFNGSGAGLTGTASSLNIGGNAATATSTQRLDDLTNYSFSSSVLPTSYPEGMQLFFVGPAVGEGSWQNYGSVITARTYSGGGGSLQMYVPYGPSNGGDALQVRFGNYNVSSGNSWTAWKTLLQSDNYGSYALPLSGGTMGGHINMGAWNITNITTLGAVTLNLSGTATVGAIQGTGGSYIQSTSTGTAYTAAWQIREKSGGIANTNVIYAPQLAFHWGGVVASSILLESSGRVSVRNNPGTGYEQLIAGATTVVGYSDSIYLYVNYNNTINVCTVSATGTSVSAHGILDLYKGGTSNIQLNANNTSNSYINAGNFGIGTTSPSQLLHVNGNALVASFLYINTISDNVVNNNNQITGNHTGSTYTQWRIKGSKNSYAGFFDEYSGVNGMMYDIDGNGGIYREGSGRWYLYHNVSNNCLGVAASTTSSSYRLYVSGAIYSTDDIVAYSDRRKKTNIITIDNALDKVNRMRGVFYDKIDDIKKGRQTGVIAQEINEVLPEVVTYAKDVDEYGVSYGNVVGVLIEAIKEQCSIIDKLSKRIEDLENK